MKSWTTQKGHTITRILSGAANAYFIRTDQFLLMVDTGTASSFKRLKKNLANLMGDHEKLDVLVLTHSHYDHCQNAARIRDAYQCKIVMGGEEASYTTKGFTPLPRGTFLFTRWLTALGNRIGPPKFGYEAFTPDLLIHEDQPVDEKTPNIHAIKTKGHTMGSISLIIDQEVALVGDAMFGIFKNSIYPPFADDKESMANSWNKLFQTGCRIFLPGHGRPVKRELIRKKLSHTFRLLFLAGVFAMSMAA